MIDKVISQGRSEEADLNAINDKMQKIASQNSIRNAWAQTRPIFDFHQLPDRQH